MRARTAYISSLGTTGVLIAAALAMLVLVGALVAFDRWPSHAVAEAETVPIADDGPAAIRRAAAPSHVIAAAAEAAGPTPAASGSADAVGGAAARAGRLESRSAAPSAPRSSARSGADPVVSALPAPDTAGEPSAPGAGPAAPTADPAQQPSGPAAPVIPLPGPNAPTGGDGLSEATGQIGETLSSVSPALGQAVRGTGSTLDATVTGVLGRG